ncbi:acyl carrier protein [Nocardia terpenica]|uniref:acyl carrier protein n=1 Tax=Nocardia terpenica TaxID=455432 RepID=UPI001893275D|nr:acyl carrier protein [Nocardia terpenica]MBF6061543.1 acyl carrier protein [Nocardia terpenica]MBF6105228.1 acyl carrier protein [Nocardia terpenica]MBF6113302.1 acyl carrier protein [Nocardia terpenica]MBF6119432.1 acyl carrier protein [Nocardia terpenica]MBF6153080.1 acyl carrier protein [Nocardia terpenica]
MTGIDHSTPVRVRELIAAMAPDPRSTVTDDQQLVTDLGFDSLRLMELTLVLEQAFDLPRYRPDQLAGVHRVSDVIALIERALSERTQP